MDIFSILGVITLVIVLGLIIAGVIFGIVKSLIKLIFLGVCLLILFFALKGCVGM